MTLSCPLLLKIFCTCPLLLPVRQVKIITLSFENLIERINGMLNAVKENNVNLFYLQLKLKYNIIKHGKILKQDIKTKIRVESEILSNYLDMKYFIDRHTNIAIKRIAKVGLL